MYRKCLIVFLSLFLLILSKLASSYTSTRPTSVSTAPTCSNPPAAESPMQCAAP